MYKTQGWIEKNVLLFFLFKFCCFLQNYYNVYSGQQFPFRWFPAYSQPFYGLSRQQFVPTAHLKKTQTTDMSPQEFGMSEAISPSPSISSTGLVSNQLL